MRKTLLVIGDLMTGPGKPEPSLGRFLTYKARLNRRNIGFVLITYDDLLNERLPEILAKRVEVLLFFPYNYWNSIIEIYDRDDRIYGDNRFGSDYKDFFLKVSRILRKKYRDKDLTFVNPPLSCALDRDKMLTSRLLKKAGIETPHIYRIASLSQAKMLIDKGKGLYVKPRFGAMGKGITYLSNGLCHTNFIYKKGRIISRNYDYNWKTQKISKKKRDRFLKILIKKGFIFQDEIDPVSSTGRRFDIRAYVINGKVPYLYAKSAPRDSFITNWSQGGRIEKKKGFLTRVLGKRLLKRIKAAAIKAAGAAGLGFAGVDVIVDKDRRMIYILEIQSFPGYERGFDLMKSLADAI